MSVRLLLSHNTAEQQCSLNGRLRKEISVSGLCRAAEQATEEQRLIG